VKKKRIHEQPEFLDIGLALLLGLIVFLSRYLNRGPVYYVDGPSLVQCIVNHTYVIQPPGYWLFAHLGGLFQNPSFGLQFLNEIFSSSGIAIFFLLCRKMDLDRKMACAATVCYGSIFFVWLAGDIHSSYASQILFAPLLVYLFLNYRDYGSTFRLLACGACFSVGAGLRPSDGAFLVPLLVFLTLQFVRSWRHRIWLIFVTVILCLVWYIPTRIASRAAHIVSMGTQMDLARVTSPLIAGFGTGPIANTTRVIFPFLAAFWILIPAVFLDRTRFENRMTAVWIGPGLLFFLLVYIADPVYFTYFTAAVILFAALSRQRSPAIVLLLLCAAFNLSLFFFARPVRGGGRVDQALNFYVIKYCDYGLRHEWTSTLGKGGGIP
jgi:hypothetical protein